MKILRVAPDSHPYTVGGFDIHIHEMSKEHVRLGHDVTVHTASEFKKGEIILENSYYFNN